MAQVEFRPKGGSTFARQLDRIPVAGDYLYMGPGPLGRVHAVVLTPGTSVDAVAFLIMDPDGKPDETSNADFG